MTTETESKYRMRKAEQRESLPAIDLLPSIQYRSKQLDMALFGPSTYRDNQSEMVKQYWNSNSLPRISFRPARTSESISAAVYDFENEAKLKIFNSNWLQLGYIVRTENGVFTNTKIIDEEELKGFLDRVRKVNGIYLLDNGIGFAPYESFNQSIQDSGDFAESGLARVLEHTEEESAPNLREISSTKFYPNGVNVLGFDSVREPVLRVSALGSDWDDHGLGVSGDCYGDSVGNDRIGYAFGVLNETAEGSSQKV